MTQVYILFAIRVLSALLLLSFLAGIAWLAYQDLRLSAQLVQQEQRIQGHLRVVGSESGELSEGTLFPMQTVTTIGRAQGSTVVLNDSYVSNEHALLTHRIKHWWLEDLRSSNGTLLNDIAIAEAVVVSSGDIITIGGTRLLVEPLSYNGLEKQKANEQINDSSS